MTRAEFEVLVARLEKEAATNPQNYKQRVLGIVALGYGYVVAMLFVLIALTALAIWITLSFHAGAILKLDLALLFLIYVVARSLWVRLEAPQGIQVTRTQAPKLFEAVDDIRARLDAPQPHHVLITDDFNAAAAQIPRLGLFGWQKQYLILGLPYLLSNSPEHVRSVIAHEFGHLSRNHGKFSSWIYRTRRTWANLQSSMEQNNGHGSWLFNAFLNWYAPRFSAYTFVLARADEYVADRCAAEATSPHITADALTRTHVVGAYFDHKVWPGVFESVKDSAEPPDDAFHRVAQVVQEPLPAEAQKWFVHALRQRSDVVDTHPALCDRLRSLGEEAREEAWQQQPTQNAAEFFLGESLPVVTDKLNEVWRNSVRPGWFMRHEFLKQARAHLQTLDEKETKGEALSAEELWQRAEIVGELEDSKAALPHLQRVLEKEPNHVGATFEIGRILIGEDQEEGISYLEKVMKLEPASAITCNELLYNFYQNNGDEEKAQQYRASLVQSTDELEAASEERSRISAKDTFLPHDLAEAQLQPLLKQLEAQPEISAAYLVKKKVEKFAEKPLFVLAIKAEKKWHKLQSEDYTAQVCQQFAQNFSFDEECLIFSFNDQPGAFQKALQNVEGSCIFERIVKK